MRIALGIEYQGTNYQGWQRQSNAVKSIQLELEIALSKVANHKVDVICAGRTDAGVHATSQVVHFDSNANRSESQWLLGVNALLPKDIRVVWSKQVSFDFHARFSANYRHYQYLLWADPKNINNVNALFSKYITNPRCVLDVDKMDSAAHFLLGEHDFSAFRGSGCQSKTPMRNINAISVKKHGDIIIIDIIANAFLYHMVRNIVGALYEVGSNNKPINWIQEVLEGKNRSVKYRTMPSCGLYLVGVGYHKFNDVELFSYFRKIMLVSGHSPLIYNREKTNIKKNISNNKLCLNKDEILN